MKGISTRSTVILLRIKLLQGKCYPIDGMVDRMQSELPMPGTKVKRLGGS